MMKKNGWKILRSNNIDFKTLDEGQIIGNNYISEELVFHNEMETKELKELRKTTKV